MKYYVLEGHKTHLLWLSQSALIVGIAGGAAEQEPAGAPVQPPGAPSSLEGGRPGPLYFLSDARDSNGSIPRYLLRTTSYYSAFDTRSDMPLICISMYQFYVVFPRQFAYFQSVAIT